MILVDFSQVMIAALMINSRGATEIPEDLVRHMVLNTLRSYRSRFGKKHGELVLCHDSRDPWRRDIFPLYKANRIKQREASLAAVTGKEGIDWGDLLDSLNKIRDELASFFPYMNLSVPRAEADDIIAVVCEECHDAPVLIISSDKDFQQLQKYPNVSQWSPSLKEIVKCKDPLRFLKEHVMRGDSGDGVPNFLSADDSIITEGKRQKPISSKKVETWLDLEDPADFCNELQLCYLDRNRQMVDFAFIPKQIHIQVMENFRREIERPTDRSKIFPYMVKNRLTQLLGSIQEF